MSGMEGKGTILRLIDVVLIILVGFVAVADITPKSRLNFPLTGEEEQQETREKIVITIEVTVSDDDGVMIEREYLERNGEKKSAELWVPNPHYEISWYEGFRQKKESALTPDDLEMKLVAIAEKPDKDIEAITVIPDPESSVEGTVVIYDICDRSGLPEPGVDLTSGTVE